MTTAASASSGCSEPLARTGTPGEEPVDAGLEQDGRKERPEDEGCEEGIQGEGLRFAAELEEEEERERRGADAEGERCEEAVLQVGVDRAGDLEGEDERPGRVQRRRDEGVRPGELRERTGREARERPEREADDRREHPTRRREPPVSARSAEAERTDDEDEADQERHDPVREFAAEQWVGRPGHRRGFTFAGHQPSVARSAPIVIGGRHRIDIGPGATAGMDPAVLRADMVDGLVHESKGHVHDEALADAMSTVEREAFVPEEAAAYQDRSHECMGTRVLSPSLAARLLDALALDDDQSVLVVGAGVGYTAAIAAEIAGEQSVQAVDIARPLVWEARSNLADAGYEGVLVDYQDGADGLPEYAPYDRILLEAAAIEPPRALIEQLTADGRLVMPRGAQEQRLRVLDGDGDPIEDRSSVAFNPMLVDGEQTASIERNRTHREERERAAKAAESRTGWEREWIDWEQR